ncbi:acyl-CoA N-acyltransferase [Marasmius fiardii PR-910]|nr:acyl-CoA N-acyltransferase [Marasmius fiardii PR-910]
MVSFRFFPFGIWTHTYLSHLAQTGASLAFRAASTTIMFSTPRLCLRAAEDSDIGLLRKLWNVEAVQRTISIDYLTPKSSKSEEFLEKLMNDIGFFIIESKDAGTPQFVGFASLSLQHRKHRDAQYSIAILPQFWGKGYATEVTKFVVDHGFIHFGLHRISLGVLEENQAARNMYKKVGFIEEGRRRKSIWVGGKWEDSIMMGILEEEWPKPSAE